MVCHVTAWQTMEHESTNCGSAPTTDRDLVMAGGRVVE
jgi:hypothetical protein